eukprot:TRINITY_DN28559_c0_g1_i1.p1 TRINITY_DN28559_c0_g1~~TRINITY_DN28559_c0_g1_i1.p1  ORF type:complete len:108 (-),score=28.34 TRINITY_DN28559_c0_g1_i1:2-325(-)
MRNKRKNIKDVLEEERLDLSTKAAKAEEEERLKRLKDQNKLLVMEALRTNHERYMNQEDEESINLGASSGGYEQIKEAFTLSSDSDECKVISDDADSVVVGDKAHRG